MLQQTQVSRVVTKYPLFLKRFPTFQALAAASQFEVLAAWQGLGYNRRGLALHKLAKIVVRDYHGTLPSDPEVLVRLPGIGKATAGSLLAFVFNKPVPFIETNIRRVYIHFFFPRRKKVSDEEILAYVVSTLDKKNPREWYWALMDYGSMLAKQLSNPNLRSKHYRRQSPFMGSLRQVRGKILKALIANNSMTLSELGHHIKETHERINVALAALEKEGFLRKQNRRFFLTS